MTGMIIKSTRSELQAYLLELRSDIHSLEMDITFMSRRSAHLQYLAIEVLERMNELDLEASEMETK